MYIHVRLLNGFKESLLYRIPEDLERPAALIGAIVCVPLAQRVEQALIIATEATAKVSFVIKDIISFQAMPDDAHHMPFIQALANYYQTDALYYLKRMHQFIAQPDEPAELMQTTELSTSAVVNLTVEQQAVVDYLTPHITKPTYTPTVLHGVTGSGKTEVYKKLLTHTYYEGKIALLMLPEVSLALQFERLLRNQLPADLVIASFHSATTPKEKRIVWQRLRDQQPMIIIGVHVPILLPLPHLGLIIVDEEHEVGYQEKKHPKTHTKEAALMRAQMHGIPILLGSATPSISTLYNVKQRGWKFFQLKQRFAGAFPVIKQVVLPKQDHRPHFWISRELNSAIKDRLARGEQTILFLNRRGFSFFVQCKACTHIFSCNACSVSLTLHEQDTLICHYCGYRRTLPPTCPTCKTSADDFLKKGIGTQQLAAIVQKLFPSARVARADLDVSSKKKAWQQVVEQFHARELDILVGTQTITKGYDFEHVTLVGIIWADLNLHFPKFNATETTLQQLIQVAGRAGRKREHSLVIVQTMAEHHAFAYLEEISYLQFYQQEILQRQEVGYPPCKRLVEIELKYHDEATIEREARHMVHQLLARIEQMELDIQVLGPSCPPIAKIKKSYARTLYLKGTDMSLLEKIYHSIDFKRYKSSCYFTPNPVA
jgi:primosomal protein N' (replication factor Y)